MLIPNYLKSNFISSEEINAVKGMSFLDNTKMVNQIIKNHPQNLLKRYEVLINVDMLTFLLLAFNNFNLYKNQITSGQEDKVCEYLDCLEGSEEFNRAKYLLSLIQMIPEVEEIVSHGYRPVVQMFVLVGQCLQLKVNLDQIPINSVLLVLGGPIEEMQMRVVDAIRFSRQENINRIIVSGANVNLTRQTEAEYLCDQIGAAGIEKEIILENKSRNTGDHAKYLAPLLKRDDKNLIIITTNYDSLRTLLTLEKQLNFKISRLAHGSDFLYNNVVYWSAENWWQSTFGWLATGFSLTRLIKYRAQKGPWL